MAITWRKYEWIDRLRQKPSGSINITSTFLTQASKTKCVHQQFAALTWYLHGSFIITNNVLFEINWYTKDLPPTECIYRVHQVVNSVYGYLSGNLPATLVICLVRQKKTLSAKQQQPVSLFFAAHLNISETTAKSWPGDNSGTSFICRVRHANAAFGWKMDYTSNSLLRLVFFVCADGLNMPHAAKLGCWYG
jgi:hypothetical protein